MLFTGQSEHSIDQKLRLAIPAKYRNQWDSTRDGAAWFSLPWPTGHVRLFTEGEFHRLAEQRKPTLTPSKVRAEVDSLIFGYAERLEMDSNGRITLPRKHIDLTRLGTDVMVVGVSNRLEVHDREKWETEQDQNFPKLLGLIEQLEKLEER
ncbi:MAG: hypothetical protein H7Y88_08625 [Phycisphaerales bacterium]|nr:hypothetical protein [Phycisphaerales bacterium]